MDGHLIHEASNIPLQILKSIYCRFYLLDIQHMLLSVASIIGACSLALTCFIISFESREDGFYVFVSPDPNTNPNSKCSLDVFEAVIVQS